MDKEMKKCFFVLFYDLSKLSAFILLLTHTVGPSIISLIAASKCRLSFCSVLLLLHPSINLHFLSLCTFHPPSPFFPSLMGDRQNPSSKTLLVLSLPSFPINSLCWSSFLINRISRDTLECSAGSILINTMLCKNEKERIGKICTRKTSNEAVINHQHVCPHTFQSTTCDRHRKLQHMPSCVMSAWMS